MLIGILQTGDVPEALAPRHGEYAPMFEAWLGPAGPGLAFRAYGAHHGALPAGPADCDAWLITGSKHGVYDDLPWIAPLKAFLRDARAAGRPIVGVCFGHQILAEALGGRAEKSAKGWGAGVHDYQVVRRTNWMNGGPDSFAIHTMHQDQVTAIPEDATVLAASPFCEFAMLAYGDPEAPDAISIQPHPEFGADYARELVEMRTGVTIPADRGAAALASFGRPVNRQDFARWCVDYLRAATARRSGA
ncbi:MAG: type 1 glutamine amidotransferase [Proteobacteria bacterium]|nr:type 1 glutamine amidotransferase [Pseudomonadota bacterium]